LKIFYYFSDDIRVVRIPLNYKKIVKEIEAKEKKQLGEICYIFVSPKEILRINHDYLQHDFMTDVITFGRIRKRIRSGDIYICPDVLYDNANVLGINQESELLRVMIHGILHIMDYKDESQEEKMRIHKMEDVYMDKYNKLLE